MTEPRFPLGGGHGGKTGTQSSHSRHASVTKSPVPSPPAPSPRRVGDRDGRAQYVELHAHSAYSFLDGASLPEELAARAAELGYDALALTDHDGVYGSLEFAHACKHFGIRPITGAEVTLRLEPPEATAHITLLCETQAGYANL